jgi:uncharacterized membrane protein YbhN (UPF0104 family)
MTDVVPLEPTEPSGSVWRARLRWVVLVSGLAGLAIVTRQALTDDESAIPGPVASAAALVLYGGAGVSAARAWSILLGPSVDPLEVRGAMYASQLSKYVPGGGVLQAAGQVVLSTSDRLTMRRSALAWATSMVLTLVAGLVLLGALALLGGFEGGLRLVALLGFASLLVVDRRRLAWVLTQARRLTARIPEPDLLPEQRALHVALVWTAGSLLLSAASYSTILVDLDSAVRPVEVLPAFVAGWLAGFLLVPLPAGLGAREAILVGLIPGSTTGLVLAASLSQRLIAFVAEVVLLTGNRLVRRRRRAAAG